MRALLTHDGLFDPSGPGTWAPVLEDLATFEDLRLELGDLGANATERQRLEEEIHRVHRRLLEHSATLVEPQAITPEDEPTLRAGLVEAVWFLRYYAESVGVGEDLIDTAGSRTLDFFRPDFVPDAESVAALEARVQAALADQPGAWDRIHRRVEAALEDARRKRRVMRAVREVFELESGSASLDSGLYKLFTTLYPQVPLLPDEVAAILSGTMIVFCFPFEGERLTTPRFDTLDDADRRSIERFLRRLAAPPPWVVGQFPAFGAFDGRGFHRGLLAQLADRSGLAAARVLEELGQMTTILPLAEVDKYIVHDLWGHSYQATMLDFESMYQRLAEFSQPLSLDHEVTAGTDRLTVADCFVHDGAGVTVDEKRLERLIVATLSDRLPVALTAAVSELMADIAEHKFLTDHPQWAERMPSSSLFKGWPSKLDLSLSDLGLFHKHARRVFHRLAASSRYADSLTRELVATGADEGAAASAVREAIEVWQRLAEGPCAPRIWWRRDGEGVRVNLYTRLALNALSVHGAVVRVCDELEGLTPQHLPLDGWRDLLMIAASVFFELDRPSNLWRMDEFLDVHFVSLCRWLDGEPMP